MSRERSILENLKQPLQEGWKEKKNIAKLDEKELREYCLYAQELLRTARDYSHAVLRMERHLGKVRIPVGFKFEKKVVSVFKDNYREQFSDFEEMKEDELAYRHLLYLVFLDMVEESYSQYNMIHRDFFHRLEGNTKLL